MLVLKTLHEAEKFVNRQQRLGNNVRWDGWNMVFFRAHESARFRPQGVWNAEVGDYGFDNRSVITDEGTWEVDYRNVKRAKRNRV